jgi:hypothetical protein
MRMNVRASRLGRLAWEAVRLIPLVGLMMLVPSCAASARIGSLLDACQRNPGQCEAECAQATGAVGPGRDNYCDAIEVIHAEGVIRTAGQQPPSTESIPYLRARVEWMTYLCDNEGVVRACAARDGLRPLLASSQAQYAGGAAQDQERKAAVEAKLAEVVSIATANPSFHPEQNLAGVRDTLRMGDVVRAEGQADAILNLAKQVQAAAQRAAAQAERQAQLLAEQGSIQAATSACGSSLTACKAKCDAGEGPSCVAWGTSLWKATPPKLPEARDAMSKGCAAGTQTACASVAKIDADIQRRPQALNEMWETLQQAGDEIATNRSKAEEARSLEPKMSPASQLATERTIRQVAIVTSAAVEEKYCPAKRVFVAQAGAAEFTQRAADHCNAASARSWLRVDPAKCRAVFATACP